MTERTGWDESNVRDWLPRDTEAKGSELQGAWETAACVIAADRPGTSAVLDAGSGPGGFLGALLAAFPGASGTWLDSSLTMRDEATQRLAGSADQITFFVDDLLTVGRPKWRERFDAVLSSRITHHLSRPDLGAFYRHAHSALKPGGWVANLDSVRLPGEWDALVRRARKQYRAGGAAVTGESGPSHPHLHPVPSMADHLDAINGAGFGTAQTVWAAFSRVLIMARKPDDH